MLSLGYLRFANAAFSARCVPADREGEDDCKRYLNGAWLSPGVNGWTMGAGPLQPGRGARPSERDDDAFLRHYF
jgi:hypothetical protein